MHRVLIILTLTFIQGQSDLDNEYITCLIISKTIQAMPINFAVKIVRLKVYTTIASPMTLTFTQGPKCVTNVTTYNLQYIGQYLSYYIQTCDDDTYGCPICSCSFG